MIGIFDSGIGGLTVVKALRDARPDLSFVYLGDTARAPYGTKSPETIRRYAEEAVRFLKKKGAKAIVVACNTASALAADYLRETFPGLPVFEVVGPAVRAALAVTKSKRVGVIGTRATVASGVYESSLKAQDPSLKVFSNPAPLLVGLVEEGWIDTPEAAAIVGKYVAPVRQEGVDALILGCTHYPLLKRVIAERMGPEVRLVDSAEAAARELARAAEKDPALSAVMEGKGKGAFYVTDPTPAFASLGSEWLGMPVRAAVTTL